MSVLPSRLYAILDPDQTGDRPFAPVLDAMLAGGVSVLQLRVKERPADEFLRLALTARERTSRAGCLFIVNDRVDIALAAGADGVHLGTRRPAAGSGAAAGGEKGSSASPPTAWSRRRRRNGAAPTTSASGPCFPTRTKETGYETRGLSMLASVRRRVSLPIVAIGGITAENVVQTWDNGADAAAMISYLTRSGDVAARVRSVLDL